MRRLFIILALTLAAFTVRAAGIQNIRISTDAIDLVLQVAENNRLYQVYLG